MGNAPFRTNESLVTNSTIDNDSVVTLMLKAVALGCGTVSASGRGLAGIA